MLLGLSVNLDGAKETMLFTGAWSLILSESLSGNFPQISSWIYVLFPMRFFMKSQIIRCMGVVGGLALPYYFLLLNPNPSSPTWLYNLFRESKLSGRYATEVSVLCILCFVFHSFFSHCFYWVFLWLAFPSTYVFS